LLVSHKEYLTHGKNGLCLFIYLSSAHGTGKCAVLEALIGWINTPVFTISEIKTFEEWRAQSSDPRYSKKCLRQHAKSKRHESRSYVLLILDLQGPEQSQEGS
jgi:hypothetical protein